MTAAPTDGPRTENVIELALHAPVTLQSLTLALAHVRRQSLFRPRTRFVLDCAAADDLSPQVLADFARLRGELRREGSDLALAGCGPTLRRRLNNPLYAPLLANGPGPWSAHAAHPARGPHRPRLLGRA